MNIIKDLLFSTSLKASFIRVVSAGIGYALTALTGFALFADIELPSESWINETAAFITSAVLIIISHGVSLIGTKNQKDETPK